jgi:ADP-heptose:LPS heptosyltransferase
MQKVDYWLGIPVCFALSAINSAKSVLFTRRRGKPKRILFIELSEMGSAVLAHSAIEEARRIFPDGEFYFLIFERNRESVELTGSIPTANILTIKDRNFVAFALSTILRIFDLWRRRIDTVIDMELFSRCTAILSFLSGARNRVGFYQYTEEGLYRGNLLTHRVFYNPFHHIALNFLNLVLSLEEEAPEPPLLKRDVRSKLLPPPQIPFEQRELMQARSLLGPTVQSRPVVLLNPDPGLLPLRGWGIGRFVDLARRILEARSDVYLAVVGLSRSRDFVQPILKLDETRVLDLTGRTRSMRELIALCAVSNVLVTNDSGPGHFASLTGINSIVLFGPETPARYGPLGRNSKSVYAFYSCSPCFSAQNHRRSVCTNNRCMQAISVDEVFEVVSDSLTKSSAGNA